MKRMFILIPLFLLWIYGCGEVEKRVIQIQFPPNTEISYEFVSNNYEYKVIGVSLEVDKEALDITVCGNEKIVCKKEGIELNITKEKIQLKGRSNKMVMLNIFLKKEDKKDYVNVNK
jgi:hypothetical protein